MLGFSGVTAMACRVAGVTVSVMLLVIVPDVAEMTEVPAATPVARPVVPMLATVVVADDQVTEALTSFVVPSE